MHLIKFQYGQYQGFKLMSDSAYDNYKKIMDRAEACLRHTNEKFYVYPSDRNVDPIIIGGVEALKDCFKEEEFAIEACLALMSLVDYNINKAYGFFPLNDINNALWEFASIVGD